MKSLLLKFGIIGLVILATFIYARSWQVKFSKIKGNSAILKTIPNIEIEDIFSKKKFTTESIYKNSPRVLFVHLWATWCAPCEAELPEFIEFAKENGDKRAMFVILAVNDSIKKVKKFIKKSIPQIPSNVIFAMDNKGIGRTMFGTVKVPETFLFDSSGAALKKYIGAQNWKRDHSLNSL